MHPFVNQANPFPGTESAVSLWLTLDKSLGLLFIFHPLPELQHF